MSDELNEKFSHDQLAARGFRSQAQSRWAHATNQWFADEYDQHTNYDNLPDRVQEDVLEEIAEYGILTDAENPLVSEFDDLDSRFQNIEDKGLFKKFVEISKDFFKFIKRFHKIHPDVELIDTFYSQMNGIMRVAKQYISNGQLKDKVAQQWDEFIVQQEMSDDERFDDMKQDDTDEVYSIATQVGQDASKGLSDQHVQFLSDYQNDVNVAKYVVRGMLSAYTTDETMEGAMNLNENALLRKIVRENNIDQKMAEDFWSAAVTEQDHQHGADDSKGKSYWNAVIESFNKKIKNLDFLEAKRIMEHKRNLKASIDSFIDNLAKQDYTAAQVNVPSMVQEKMRSMINSKKEAYLKELGSQVQERAKEV